MTISTTFPLNITDVLKTRIDAVLQPSVPSLFRPLRTTDPDNSIGIFPVDWGAQENTILMGGPRVPTLQRYNFRIHQLVKHTDEAVGRAQYSQAAKNLRVMLYHDPELRIALGQLVESESDRIERFMLAGIRQQRFLSNELSGNFIYLCSTEYWTETETISGGI